MNQNGFEPQNTSYGQQYNQQQGFYPGNMNGYASQSAGYQADAGAGANAAPVWNGYPPRNEGTASRPGVNSVYSGSPAGYSPYMGNGFQYAGGQPENGYSAPQPQPVPGGSFIPQTPYSPGYTSPGYTPQGTGQTAGYPQASAGYPPMQGGYQTGYSAYQQMGRPPQAAAPQDSYAQQVPLNGGGYVPKSVPVRRPPFQLTDPLLYTIGAVLVALFVAAVLVLQSMPLKIVFIVLSVATVAMLWIRPMTAQNKRLCYSIIALALCAVTVVSMVAKKGATDNPANPGGTIRNNPGSSAMAGGEMAGNPDGQAIVMTPVAATNTPEPVEDNLLYERLISFFSYWSNNRYEEMLTLCAPTWQVKQENAKNELFQLIANRKPKEVTRENITGTSEDSSRQVTVTALIDRNNGKEPVKYRLTILMVKENGEWYVDPRSLQTYEKEEAPTDSPTPGPTPTAAPNANTVLYYNPDGGSYYHASPNCSLIAAKYLPLKGSFTYAQINDPAYAELRPCSVCGAPLR